MSALADGVCVPCRGGVPPLAGEALADFCERLGNNWKLVDDHHLEKQYKFDDFAEALAFVNRIGQLAEEVGHHPEIFLTWGWVRLKIWTHKIDGLTESDFVWAAKADRLERGSGG
jgi:4a-hydroxytetrahydrobiopterin dehydratase